MALSLKQTLVASAAIWFGVTESDMDRVYAKFANVNSFCDAIDKLETPKDLPKFGLRDPGGDKGGQIMRNLKKAKAHAAKFRGYASHFDWATKNDLSWDLLSNVSELQWEAFALNPFSLLPHLIRCDVKSDAAFAAVKSKSKPNEIAERYAQAWLYVSRRNKVLGPDLRSHLGSVGCKRDVDDLFRFDPTYGIIKKHELFGFLHRGDGTFMFKSTYDCMGFLPDLRASQKMEFYEMANDLAFETTTTDSGLKSMVVYTVASLARAQNVPKFFAALVGLNDQDTKPTRPAPSEDRANTDETTTPCDSSKRPCVRGNEDEEIDE